MSPPLRERQTYDYRQPVPTTELRAGDQIKVRNVTYVVERVLTQSGHAREGYLNLALLMEVNKMFAQVTLRRPRGTALHLAMLTESGVLGELTRV